MPLAWIERARNAPYFVDEHGSPWTPIGQNDAITWPELRGLFRRRDIAPAEIYLQTLAEHGVTCLRLMLEYSQTGHRYFERRAGVFNPELVLLWDDLFSACRRYGLRVLLTPYDTFWMWMKWKNHPYSTAKGGPCRSSRSLLLCPDTRLLIKQRLRFATERWGGDGAIFAWDLWNEIHPAQAQNSADCFFEFVEDISTDLSSRENQLYGRAHLQTVSVFTPAFILDSRIANTAYRHPCLHFSNIHLYEEGTIDHPRNTVDAAVSTGKLVAEALAEIRDFRPFFDSEHGPIHTFKDHHRTLPEAFDDEYFRHMQWAHFASGGAGGGMRWPNRRVHSLTPGMRLAQKALADFLPLIDWVDFKRINRNATVEVSRKEAEVFACSDERQAVVYLLRRDTLRKNGMLNRSAPPLSVSVRIPGLTLGSYSVTAWDPVCGKPIAQFCSSEPTIAVPSFTGDIALAVVAQPIVT